MRGAFARALLSQAVNDRIVVLDGDCARSTKTDQFAHLHPARFIDCGIAEQNMVSVAAGLARSGFIPIVCGFAAILMSRAAEQLIHGVGQPGLPVKIIGHYAGLSASLEGAPHHALCDLAIASGIPGMSIHTPCDDADVADSLAALLATPGPGYLRLSRNPVERCYAASESHELCPAVSRLGDGRSFAIIVASELAVAAIDAWRQLASIGKHGRVILVREWGGMAENSLSAALRDVPVIVSVEDHGVAGGLASFLSVGLLKRAIHPRKFRALGIGRFSESGDFEWLVDHMGLGSSAIQEALRDDMELEPSGDL